MPFGAHETMEVHEILNEKINMINHFSLYMEHAQDPQLKHMISRHLQTVVQGYDQLVAYTHDYTSGSSRQQGYGMPGIQPQQIQYGLHNPAPVGPQMHGRLSDQQIVCALLSCHKNSAKNHMLSALECADPNVRQMLMNGANICANQAYEVFLFMNQHGQYQVPTMNEHTAKTYLHSYQPAGEQMSGGMDMNGYGGMGSAMGGQMGGQMGGHMGSQMSSQMNNQMNQMNQMNNQMNNQYHNQMGGSSPSQSVMHGSQQPGQTLQQ